MNNQQRLSRYPVFFAIGLAVSTIVSAAPVLNGPPPRQITDPRSLTSPTLATSKPISIPDLFFTRSGLSAAWSADGRDVVVSTDLTGRLNLWKVPAKGGFPLQLTRSDDSQFGQLATPDGQWIIFQSDVGGREMYDLYAVPAAGGEVVNLTNTADATETDVIVSPHGSLLAFRKRLKTAPSTNAVVLDLATRTLRQLTEESDPGMSWYPAAFSRDGQRLITNRINVNHTESSVWSIDVGTGHRTLISGASRYNYATDISPDGRWVAVTTETAAGDRQSALLDVTNKQVTLLAPDRWEQHSGNFSPDGRTLLAISNVDGRDVVLSYDLTTRRVKTLPMPEGIDTDEGGLGIAFSPDGLRLLFSHESGSASFDYWVMDLSTGESAPITSLGLASIRPEQLPKTIIVHYRSADDTVISAFVWVPFNLRRDGSAPAVVMPHGGPTSQMRDEFSRTAIALATRGYLVIAPNPRGSTGYGRAFEEGNRHDLGGGDLEDEIAGAKFCIDTGYVDSKKIGITGGSYGGYMTLIALSKAPAYWAAGVEEYGIVNWRFMLDHTQPGFKKYVESLVGDPKKDRANYETASPLTYLAQVRAPLLVLQGENDIRVPKEESELVVDSLRRSGQIVEAHVYPEEGHGFAKRENQIDALQRLVDWFEKYLKATDHP